MPVGRELHALLAGWITKGSPEAEYLAARFQESALGHRASQAKRVEREFDFLFECEGVMVSGQIDLWFEESGGQLVLVDYKTGEEEGWERYVPQVETYALALERLTGQLPGECYLYFARSGRAIAVPVNSSRARDRIRSAASAGEPSAPRRQAAGS
jgi:ATP-dependent exoDNAse (exonuclease V) beta subunit